MAMRFITKGRGKTRKVVPLKGRTASMHAVLDPRVGAVKVVRRGDHICVKDKAGDIHYRYSTVTGRYSGATKYHDVLASSPQMQERKKIELAINTFMDAENLIRDGKFIRASELKGRFKGYCDILSDKGQKEVYDYLDSIGA